MNKIDLIHQSRSVEHSALAPIQDYLVELHKRISRIEGGSPADYIPELGKVDPDLFGIAIATVDGQLYTVGDAKAPFTIQSVSKPFMYGYALQHSTTGASVCCGRSAWSPQAKRSTPSFSMK